MYAWLGICNCLLVKWEGHGDGHWSCTGWRLRSTGVENGVTRVWRLTMGVVCVCVCVCMFLGGVKEMGKGEMRLGERGRTEEAAGGEDVMRRGDALKGLVNY